MKVIHFIASIDELDGGTTAYMQLLAEPLKDLVDLEIATCISQHPVKIPGVSVHFFEFSLVNLFKLKKQFTTYLKSAKPDLVHINGIWNLQNAIFQFAAVTLHIPIILSPHGMLEPYILNRNKWKKKIALLLYQHKLVKQADFIHSTAELELKNIKSLGFENPSVVIPNGIDLSKIRVKENLNYSSPFQILFISRIHPKKGIEFLMEAIKKLNSDDIIVKIAGPGDKDYINNLINKARSLNISDKIEFLGPIYGEEKWKLYQSSDLFILPSYSENFGIVIPEALASGLLTIATTGTPWEELKTSDCGWWIDLSVENLVNAIESAYKLPLEGIKKKSKTGIELIQQKYDINQVALTMKEFYKTVYSQKVK
ncbi:glycosyltransferase [Flavobacterium sp. LB1P71]|uniref:glycosyltransferase n=1 Tax=unclassified Flavobacterium TaxID=196869 RepID=UPI003AAA9014